MFQISDHGHLVALHRALMEGKFADDPDDALVPYSPLVAEVCRRSLQALDKAERQRIADLDGKRRELALRNFEARLRSRDLGSRTRPLAIVRRRIVELAEWPRLDPDDRAGLVECLAAPFSVDAALLGTLVAEGDAHHGVG